jgi:serine/threonine protein kinase/Tol biopolymer transport system component
MQAERWHKIEELYSAAVRLSESERANFLAQACTGDEHLRSEIEALLAYDKDASNFLESPAVERVADWVHTIPERVLAAGTISHYRLIEKAGHGGMGIVYKAEDTTLNRFVALKFLPQGLLRDPRALSRFRREARAASALDHPNICTVYEIAEQDGAAFIAMQFLDGKTLKEIIAAGPLETRALVQLAIQICDALEAAHQAGIVHRDIKPANLFVTNKSHVKVLDFGVAKFHADEAKESARGPAVSASPRGQAATATESAYLTGRGALIGTVAYMSPEQVRGQELDARTDLFSLGAVLYEIATGTLPFRGDTSTQICDSILNVSPASPKTFNSQIPSELTRVIGKALEKDRDRRYQSAADMRRDLLRLIDRRTGVRRAVLLFATVILAVLAAATLWWSLRGRPNSSSRVVERQITDHPPEDWVTGGAISPDGRTVAYHDQTGVYLRSLDSGETRALPLAPEFHKLIWELAWVPDGKNLVAEISRTDASKRVSAEFWSFSTSNVPAPHLLWRNGVQASISPNGKWIAFLGDEQPSTRQTGGVFVGRISDRSERMLRAREETDDWLISPVWSPDGQWVAYAHFHQTKSAMNTSIEVQPAVGGPARTLVTGMMLARQTWVCDLGVTQGCLTWLKDWRLIFSARTDPLFAAAEDLDHSLWQLSIRRGSAEKAGKPERLAHWRDFRAVNLAATDDGKHLSFVKSKTWTDVYLAELSTDDRRVLESRRFTLDNQGSSPTGWTPDSQAILFASDRTPRREIFKQSGNSAVSTPIISTPGQDCDDAQFSPDGRWILYRESEHVKAGASTASRLMRRAMAGGPPEQVLEEPANIEWDYGCGVQQHSSCLLSQTEGSEVVLYQLDPVRGKGSRIGKIEVPNWTSEAVWKLSADGSRLAFPTVAGRIRILSLDGRAPAKELSLGPTVQKPRYLAWAANGQGLFSTCWSPGSFDLIYVSLTGTVSHLLQNGHRQSLSNPLTSPDGKYLAFEAQTWDSNIWVIDNF